MTLYLNPYQYPFFLPTTIDGKQCVSRCYPPMTSIVHPHTGKFQEPAMNSLCAVAPSKKDKKQFGKCPFATPVVGGWLSIPVSTGFKPTQQGIYRAILSNYYNINTWKQFKLWKNTAATDAQTQAQVAYMARIAFKRMK